MTVPTSKRHFPALMKNIKFRSRINKYEPYGQDPLILTTQIPLITIRKK